MNIKEGDLRHVQAMVHSCVDPDCSLAPDWFEAWAITETGKWPQTVEREVEGHWNAENDVLAYPRETMNIKMFQCGPATDNPCADRAPGRAG